MLNRSKVFAFRHYKEALAIALLFPKFAEGALFLGIVIGPAVFAFVFDDQEAAVVELTVEVWVEFV